jgi:exopolysaccharide biosynthesis predicted pyruvyltransferase EpsI
MLNHERIYHLQDKITKVMASLVPRSKEVILLDFPDHSNVGDSAIWLGETTFFRKTHGIRPNYVCTTDNCSFDAIEKTKGTIFLHGGGNFGDIWPDFQMFRESVLRRFPNRPIVQLPQTILFSNPENLTRSAEIINAHPSFTLLVRDSKSYDMAKAAFRCNIELCPDMAFFLGPLERAVPAVHDTLLLLRTDKEANLDRIVPSTLPQHSCRVDWLEDDPDFQVHAKRRAVLSLPILGTNALKRNKRRELLYRKVAEARLQRGINLLSSGKFIITDRLHAYILSLLLGIPNQALDNNYGKISSFIDTWIPT